MVCRLCILCFVVDSHRTPVPVTKKRPRETEEEALVVRGNSTGGDTAGGDTAGGDAAGGEAAGGDAAGGEAAGKERQTLFSADNLGVCHLNIAHVLLCCSTCYIGRVDLLTILPIGVH